MTMPVQTQKEDRRTEVEKGDKRAAATLSRQTLIEGLNHDLAGEYQAILMYTHYSAKLTGPYRRELRALFQAEVFADFGLKVELENQVADETRHKEELERIIAGWDER
jgi:rubrerythrin